METGAHVTKCKKCATLLVDQHGNREFCPSPKKNENGKYLKPDCKTTFNNAIGKVKRDKTKASMNQQYESWKSLNRFFLEERYTITIKELNDAGVDINCPIKTSKIKGTDEKVLCFIEYGLKYIDEKTFKIIKHGLTI
ncbi:hypothetical protein BH10BAC1_BH10BAC1_16680 [soil metagenome]